TTRAASLTYYGAEIGMATHTPTRRADVRDPIGITGWPKEKGRDGERTPMQWTAGSQAGFSTNPHTWLPVGSDYKTVNVAIEQADASSLLRWNQTLIAIRANNPTMHSGGIVMLDNTNPSVLSYVRTPTAGAHALVISLNMTAQPQTVHLDLTTAGLHSTRVKTLLADDASLNSVTDASNFTLPPFTSLIAEVQ
ncbi:MAG: glucohydrolase, partial [Bryocella sp.]